MGRENFTELPLQRLTPVSVNQLLSGRAGGRENFVGTIYVSSPSLSCKSSALPVSLSLTRAPPSLSPSPSSHLPVFPPSRGLPVCLFSPPCLPTLHRKLRTASLPPSSRLAVSQASTGSFAQPPCLPLLASLSPKLPSEASRGLPISLFSPPCLPPIPRTIKIVFFFPAAFGRSSSLSPQLPAEISRGLPVSLSRSLRPPHPSHHQNRFPLPSSFRWKLPPCLPNSFRWKLCAAPLSSKLQYEC